MSSLPPGSVVVYGIPIQNPETAQLVRKVMNVAAVIATLSLINVIISVASGNISGLLGLVLLGIPYCGYMGAKQRNRDMLQWFWGCNACCACLSITSVILTIVAIGALNCMCDGEASCQPQDGTSASSIANTCASRSDIETAGYISIVVYIFDAILQLLACTWGKALAESDLLLAPAAMGAAPVATYAQQPQGYPVAQGAPVGYPVATGAPAPGAYAPGGSAPAPYAAPAATGAPAYGQAPAAL